MDSSTPVAQPVTGATVETTATPAQEVSTADLPKWYTTLPEHLVNGVSKFESPEALAEGYINAQKLIGKRTADLSADEIKAILSPEDLQSIYTAKGLPKTPEEYVLPTLDKYLGDGVKKEITSLAMEHGIAPKAMEDLISFQVKHQEDSMNATRETWRNEVFAKYGKSLPKELEYAQAAIQEFGGDTIKAELDKTGLGDHPLVIDLFAKLGRSMLEDKIPHSNSIGSTKSNNKAEINKLLSDPNFMRKWKQGDKVAHAQLDALYKDS
jgi:hypothetical protein